MSPVTRIRFGRIQIILDNQNKEMGVEFYKELLEEVVTECEARLDCLEQDEMKKATDSLRQEIENENV